MSKTNSLHYELCKKGAEFMRKMEFGAIKYIAVEIVTQGMECTDVYGTTGWDSTIIEVKTSRADFKKDAKKKSRLEQFKKYSVGNYRYYLAPKGIINVNEIGENWGLLEWDIVTDTISMIKKAEYRECNNMGDLTILCSIMRREGIKKQVFNYRESTK